VNVSEGFDHGPSEDSCIDDVGSFCCSELAIDLGDEIAQRYVPKKQIKRIGSLIQPTISEIMLRYRTTFKVIRLRARFGPLVVATINIGPIAS